MYLRGKYWHYDFYINKKRYRGTTGFMKQEKSKALKMVETLKSGLHDKFATQLIIEILKNKTSVSNNIPVNCKIIWSRFIEVCDIQAGEHRRKIYCSRLRDFCSFVSKNFPGIKNLDQLQISHTGLYRNYLEKSTLSNSTRNDHIAGLKLIFSTLRKHGFIDSDPFAAMKKFPHNKVKREVFSAGELNKILSCSQGWMHHLFLLTLCTGLREGDAALLKRSEVDDTVSWITIDKTRKTGTAVDIPVIPALKEHLKKLLEKSDGSPYVHPELAAMYLKNPKNISRRIKEFFHSLEFADVSRKVEGYKHRVSVKDIHSFRHTFIYRAAAENIPLPVIQSIVGHSSGEMTRYYTAHSVRKDKAAVLNMFPEIALPAKLTTIEQNMQETSSL